MVLKVCLKLSNVEVGKKNDRLVISLSFFFNSLGDGALMASASAGSSVPKVKEVHALDLHEANVDH